MARKNKVDNAIKKRIAQKRVSEERKVGSRVERDKILIVCEGEKTEPKYFNSLILGLPKGVASITVLGTGYNTVSLVKYAIGEIEKAKAIKGNYDEVWVVFDKDDFKNAAFNAAIKLAAKHSIKCAYSNEAFELWYILHFEYLNTALKRNQYFSKLSKKLGKTYEKNNEDIIKLINSKGSLETAIKRANKLLTIHANANHAKECPKTRVHELVQKLNTYKSS